MIEIPNWQSLKSSEKLIAHVEDDILLVVIVDQDAQRVEHVPENKGAENGHYDHWQQVTTAAVDHLVDDESYQLGKDNQLSSGSASFRTGFLRRRM